LCGLPSFQVEYSPTGFGGLGPGWYIRNRDNTATPTLPPTRYNGSCAVTDLLCTSTPTQLDPARVYIAFQLFCQNRGSGIYNFFVGVGYARYYFTAPPFSECIATGYSTSGFLTYSCNPFYMEINNVDTIFPFGTSTACDGSSASLNWYITE
jgi:hypothetical protein